MLQNLQILRTYFVTKVFKYTVYATFYVLLHMSYYWLSNDLIHTCVYVFSAVEVDRMPGMDKLWVTTVKEPTPEILAIITTDGCAKLLGHMLQKCPDQVCSHKGFCIIYTHYV